jgi:hypothetical protein
MQMMDSLLVPALICVGRVRVGPTIAANDSGPKSDYLVLTNKPEGGRPGWGRWLRAPQAITS